MSIDITGPIRLTSAAGPAETAAEREQIATAAKEFEALFLLQMLKQMRQSMLGDEPEEPGFGAGTMLDTIDSELARTLSGSRGGLTPTLFESLAPKAATPMATPIPGSMSTPMLTAPVTVPVTRPLASVPAAGLPEAGAIELPAGAHITSSFGWRRDPLTGVDTFHKGVDVRAAYGQDVPAAAGGKVVFAGDQGAYGQTVVLEHATGIQTRYAHLSSIAVTAGESVADGRVIGRAGQSGRATGPHLHFEILENGRPVDPQLGAKLVAQNAGPATALKVREDLPITQPGRALRSTGDDE